MGELRELDNHLNLLLTGLYYNPCLKWKKMYKAALRLERTLIITLKLSTPLNAQQKSQNKKLASQAL